VAAPGQVDTAGRHRPARGSVTWRHHMCRRWTWMRARRTAGEWSATAHLHPGSGCLESIGVLGAIAWPGDRACRDGSPKRTL